MIYLKEGKSPLNFAYEDVIVHEGNSKYQLSFKFPTNNSIWEELTEETLLLADDLHDEQEFIIFEIEKYHGYITVYANQVATLLNNYSITELSVNNASGDRVMNALVSSIRRDHTFTFYSDIANTHSINLKNTTVANALFKGKHSILGQWGGDLIRDKYSIKLLNSGGSNKEVLFMYKKNLKSYHQKKSIKDLRTRIHFTKTITAQNENEKDRVIAVTVDSPLINKYKNIYEDNLEVTTQDVIDETTLRKYGENYFRTTLCDVLEESIEIDVVGTPEEKIGIFDTVTIFHEKFNLDVKKKITKYTYSPMGKKLKTIGFGKIQSNLGSTLSNLVDEAVSEHVESQLDAFKIQKNLAELLKSDRKTIEDKLADLEEKSKSAVEVKKALFEADGTIPEIVRTKILDAVEADISRLKTIITEAEMIKAIQAQLNYAEIKNALIDKAFINQIISDETFTQQFEDGEVNTQNIFTKLKDSIKSNISKEFVTKDGVKQLVNDLTIDANGIRQITQEESAKILETQKAEVKEIVDKYKNFESTLTNFNSTIGEVQNQLLLNEDKRNLILGSRMLSSSDYSKIGNIITLTNYVDYEGMNCLSLNVSGQSTKIWNGVGFDLSIPRMNQGDKFSLRLPIFINNHQRPDDGVFVAIKNHDTGEFIWRERLDNDNSAFGHWSIKEYHFTISKDVALTKNSFMIYHNKNGHISFVMPFLCYGETLPKKYSPAPEDVNLQNSRIETSIKQTKDQIDLKVSKDNVIASINASVERTGNGNQGVVKIKADKVDISGVLSAYAGNIGGFRIGSIDKYPGKYITGDNQFSVGMSNGNTKSPGGAALWVNWGKDWNKFPDTGWVVEHNGKMHAYNGASFRNGVSVTGPMYIEKNGGEFYYKGSKLNDVLDRKMNVSNVQYVERKQDASGPYVVFYSTAGNTYARTSPWSDKRLKSNIAETKVDALDAINQLNVYEYDFKKDDTEYHKSIGLIAQEIKEHLPDAHEQFEGIETYNPFFFIPYLVKSIQQLSAENEKLNKKIEELEGKINGKL